MTPPDFSPEFRATLAELLAWRRDVRHFRSEPLPDGLLERLLQLAALAPSVGNSQPTRFVLVRSPERRQALLDHVTGQQVWAGTRYTGSDRAHYDRLKLHGLAACAAVVGVFCITNPVEGRGLGRQTMPETLAYSTVCAIHTLWLATRAEGIGMGWVSILQPQRMAGLLDVPEDWQFVALLCLGYPQHETTQPLLHAQDWQHRLQTSAIMVER